MKLNPFAVMREEFDNTGIVFDPDNSKVMSLNHSGVLLWKVIADGGDEAACAKALLENYDGITAEQAAADSAAFIEKLRERDLLS